MNKEVDDAVAQGTPIPELIQLLESFAKAYPEEIFTPLNNAEMREHAKIITRASGAMGRHMAQFTTQAAEALAALSAQVAAGNIVIECCYAELKKALGRDIECPAYIPDAIRELAAQVVELQKDAERYRYVRAKPAMLLHLKNSEFDAAIDEKAGL